jgi:ligand-binding sensor domain-containing protein
MIFGVVMGVATNPASAQQWVNYLHVHAADTVPDYVVAAVVDPSGQKWFGSENPRGENRFSFLETSNGTLWTGYNTANGLPSTSILAVAIDQQGNKWVGTQGSGVSKFNGSTWTTYTVDSGLVDSNNVVQSITIDKQGNQWFGTSNGFSMRSASGHWTNYLNAFGTADNWSGFNPNNIHCIGIDSAGVLWVGNDVGLFSLNLATSAYQGYFGSWQGNCLVFDANGNKWVGTNVGVAKLKPDGTNALVYGALTHALAFDKSGHLWAATETDSGAIRIDTATLAKTNYPGIGSYNVYSIVLDSNDNIWCGSDMGIHELPFVDGPAVPALVAPSNNAANQALSLNLMWNSSSGATSYSVQVSTQSSFSTTIFSQAGTTASSVTLSGLAAGASYYWRVNAANNKGVTSWSTLWSFATQPAISGAPMLDLPADNAEQQALRLTLTWGSVVNSTSYGVEVSSEANFSSTIFSQTGLTSATATVAGLTNGTTYYWRADAANSATTGPWSAAWQFTTESSASSKHCGCGSGTAVAFLPPLWFKVRSSRKRKKMKQSGNNA